jgi:hypothetical protein
LFDFLLLWPLFDFLVLFLEVAHWLRLDSNFFDSWQIWPVPNTDHGALLLPRPKGELFLIAIDIEVDFSSPDINLSSYSAQKGSHKDKGWFFRNFHVEHHKVDMDEATWIFTKIFLAIPAGSGPLNRPARASSVSARGAWGLAYQR